MATRTSGIGEAIKSAAAAMFDIQLSPLGLSDTTIEEQDEQQLYDTIERLDKLLADPSSLPSLRFKVESQDGIHVPVLARGSEDAQVVLTSMPELLRRKKLALDRLRTLTAARREELKNPSSEGFDSRAESDLQSRIVALSAEELKLGVQASETGQEVIRQEVDQSLSALQLQLELERGRADIKAGWWRTRLGRDSIAAIVGGVLLVMFASSLVIGMFADVQATGIVSDSFLVLLGYFFGSASTKSEARKSEGD